MYTALLKTRRAIVTGAAGGIGAAVVKSLRQAGAEVIGTDICEIDNIMKCDITCPESVSNLFNELQAKGPVTDLVHTAGIARLGSVNDMSFSDFQKVIEVNLFGSFLVAKEAARILEDKGNLIFISSQAGIKGGGLWSAYSASKGGVIRLAEALSEELAHREILVNCISPGNIKTKMTQDVLKQLSNLKKAPASKLAEEYIAAIPLKRFGLPEEIGKVVVALCSGMFSYCTGTNIVVDGGELSG